MSTSAAREATSQPLQIAVIGLGFMGRTHVAAVQSAAKAGLPCRLAAVCDRDASRLAGGGGSAPSGNLQTGADQALFDHATVRTFTDPSLLFADASINAVCICTHTDSHVPLALAALASGKHVLIEKPVAIRSADVQRIADAARAARRVAMPALCMRFWPGWTWLKDNLTSHGQVRSATFQRLGCPPTWTPFYADTARSGGPFFDLHIHDADFVRYLFGEPREVVSTGTLHHVTTLYRFGPGPGQPSHVVAEGGLDHTPGFGFRMRFVVAFEHATADFDLGRAPQLLLHRDGRSDPIQLPAISAYEGEVRHFVEVCTNPGTPIRVSMEDAVKTTALLEAELLSQQTCAPVRC